MDIIAKFEYARNQFSLYDKETQQLLIYQIYVILFLFKDIKNNSSIIQRTPSYQKNSLLYLFRYVLLYNMLIVTYVTFYRSKQPLSKYTMENNLLKIRQFLQGYRKKK